MLIKNFENFVLVLLYGGLLIISFTILLNPMKVNKKANFFFSLFLFLWSSYWALDILRLCSFSPSPVLVSFIFFIQIFTPVFLFFSTVFFINPNYQFKKKDLVCLIVPLIHLILILNSELGIADFLAVSHNLPYIAIIYFRIKKYQKRIENISSYTETINLQWLVTLSSMLFGIIVITVCYDLFNMLVHRFNQNLVMVVLFLFIIYSTSFQVLRQKEIYPVNEKEREQLLAVELEDEEKTEKKKLIPDQEFEALKSKLLTVMLTEKPYLDGELNLLKLSDLININPHQLSYLLNNGFNENFFHFINKYRVQHAKELLTSDSYKKFSILGIAFESGFNSKTAFNTIFKKMINETPSEFRRKQSGI